MVDERPTPLVPAVPTLYSLSKLVEGQAPWHILEARRWLQELRHIAVVALHHAEQVLRGLVFVRENEHAAATRMRDAMIKPCGDVGAATLLSAFQDDRPDLADRRPLFLELGVGCTAALC